MSEERVGEEGLSSDRMDLGLIRSILDTDTAITEVSLNDSQNVKRFV